MNTSIILVFAILIALAIGFYIGKLLSKTQSNAEKSNLDGQLTSQTNQLTELKISFQNSQNEKQKVQAEKEEFAILLAKKENDFDNLLDRTKEQKEELKNIMSLPYEDLINKTQELKESITTQVSNLINESKDSEILSKLNRVKDEVSGMLPSRYNFYRLNELKNGLN